MSLQASFLSFPQPSMARLISSNYKLTQHRNFLKTTVLVDKDFSVFKRYFSMVRLLPTKATFSYHGLRKDERQPLLSLRHLTPKIPFSRGMVQWENLGLKSPYIFLIAGTEQHKYNKRSKASNSSCRAVLFDTNLMPTRDSKDLIASIRNWQFFQNPSWYIVERKNA